MCHLPIIPKLYLNKRENVSADETNQRDMLNPGEGILDAQLPAAFFLNFQFGSMVWDR